MIRVINAIVQAALCLGIVLPQTACALPVDPVRHLEEHRAALEAFATVLGQEVTHDFARFPGGSIRWDGRFIDKRSGGFVLSGTNGIVSLEQAADALGTDATVMRSRLNEAQRLRIYAVRVYHGEVEFLLDGSAVRAYGLLYVTPHAEDKLAEYRALAQSADSPYGWRTFRSVKDRWFVFSD